MKKQLFIAFALALLVPWAMKVQAQSGCTPIGTFPVAYGFEASEGFTTTVTSAAACTTDVFGTCWRNEATSGGASTANRIWHIYGGTTASQIHGGAHSLMLPDKGSSSAVHTTMLVFPAMNFTSSNGYVVSFWIYRSGTGTSTPEGFKVYASPTDTIGPNAVELGHYSRHRTMAYPVVESASGWYQYETAPITLSGTVYLIFEGQSYYSSSTYVDDVVIAEAPSCYKVSNLAVSGATESSVSLTWSDAVNSAATYNVYYFPTNDSTAEAVLAASNVADTAYTVNGLDVNTAYSFYVVADCGGGDYAANPDTVNGRTNMIPMSLPLSFNFDDSNDDANWAMTNASNGWVIDSVDGRRAMFISNDGSTNAYTITASGYSWAWVDVNVTDSGIYNVEFDWKANGEGNWDFLRVALVPTSEMFSSLYSDYPTTNVFRTTLPEGWINLSTTVDGDYKLNLSSSWQHFSSEVNIGEGREGVYHMAIIWGNDASGGTQPPAAIDNFDMYLSTCHAPTAYTVTDITPTSATLNVTHENASEFLVLYHRSGSDIWDTMEMSGSSLAFSGLSQGLEYEGLVYTICGDDTSSAMPFSFSTGCGTITSDMLPFAETFESYGSGTAYPINACWAKGTNNSTAYPYPSSTVVNGTRSLYMYGYNSSSSDYYSWAALPEVDENLAMNTLMVDFLVKRGTTASNSYTTMLCVGIAESVSGLTSADVIDSVVTWIDTIDLFNEAASSIHEVEVSFENYTGNGRYVVIYAPVPELHGTGTYCYNYAYIDDVTLRAIPTCYRPEEVVVSATGIDEVTLAWTPDTRTPSPSNWTVEYGPTGFQPGEGTTESANDTTITLTGLTANTAYDVYVSANCGGDVSDARMISFRTLCIALDVLPYTQDFEAAETSNATSETFVPCLTRLNNGTQYFGYPFVSSTASYNHTAGGTKGLYWSGSTTTGTYGDYQIVVMPAVDTTLYPINTLQLRFWARATGTSYHPVFQVGVMTDCTNASTFVPVQAVNVEGTTYTEFTVALGNYTGYGQYVAIRALRPSSAWYATVDDITLEEMPACPPITSIEASTTSGSALLAWEWQSGYEAPASYVVTYDSVGGTSASTLNVTTNSAVITGLAPLTTYKAYVQADCGADGMGGMDSVEFTTGCIGMSEIDFSNSTTGTSGCMAYSSYGNTVYQALWTASELTAMGLVAGPITAIDLGFTASTNAKEFTIFMKNTTTASISSATIETPGSQYYGPTAHPAGTEGWQHYVFDSAFVWDGTSNILMTTFMNQPTGTSQSTSTGLTGYYVSASNRARYRYKDSSPWTLSDLTSGTGGSTYSYRAAIHFYVGECTTDGCAAPSVMTTSVDATSVSLAWAPGASETSWDVDYRLVGDTTWTNAATAISTNNYTVTGLTDATNYEFRVSFTCSDAENTVYASYASATTNCLPKTMPYTENFDGITTSTTATNAGVIPTCWDFTMTGTSTYQAASYHPGVYYNANYAASGNYSLRLYGVSIVELPEMGASLDSLRLTFTDTITSASYGLIVGVMDNGSFLPIDTIELETGTRNYAEVFFRNYTGSSRTIALKNYYTTSTSTYTSYHYIDDIAVDYIPVCAHVDSLTVDSIGLTTATISWVPVNEETEWIVSDGTNTATVTATNYTFTGLTPNTSYTFEVRSVCGAGDTSEAATIQERTACALISTTPFVETFEAQPTGTSSTSSNFIPCWTRLNNGTSSGGYPYVSNTTTYNHTLGGSRGLYWYGSTTTVTYGDYMYVILPQIDVTALPVNTLQISFWARSSSTSYNPVLEVGVMNSNSDTAFVPIQTININGNTEWSEFVVPFDSYTGTGSFVAIRALRPSSAWYAYVDDISLDVIPACARVEELTATNVLLNSATITWADTSDNTAWNVEYDSVAFVPGTGHMTAIHVTDTFAVITGLDSATTYHVYVYPDCDGDAYYRHATFTTLAAAPATVPFSCNFEDGGVNGWDLINGSQVNHWMVGNATNNGGSRSLYVTNDDVNNAYTITTLSFAFASRTFSLDPGNYICSFDWKAWGESSFDFIRAALVPANTTIVAGEYCGFDNASAMPAGGIALDGGYRLNLDSTWNTQVTEISLDASGLYKLVFLWRNDGSSGTQPPAAIDNVSLVVNTCPRVTDVIALPSSNSIDLSWTPGGTETSWQVTVGTTTTVVNTPAYTVTGLVPDNDYTVSIRAICAVGDTSFVYTETFHTPCYAVSLPYSENFDTYTTSTTAATGVQVPCWNAILDGTATYQTGSYVPQIYYSSSYSHSGSYSYRLYGMGFHMLPPMPTSLDSLQLTFWDYTSSSSYGLEVGVMEGNTFVPVQTISTPTSTRTEHTVYFGSYTGSSRIIAFRNRYTTSATTYTATHYIDNVEVDYLPTCPPVVGINAASASTNSIAVDWTDQASASMWQIEYGTVGHTLGTGTRMVVTSHPYVVNGLDTLTSYDFYVRPICSSTDTGLWSPAVSLSTSICDASTEARNFDPAGTTTTSTYGPIGYSLYNYSYVQTIIDSADLVTLGGDITAFGFEVGAFLSGSSTKFENMTVYMANVSESNLTSGFIHPDANHSFQKVIDSANFNYTTSGWQIHSLDSAFTWDGHSNILISVKRDNGSFSGSQTFIAHTAAASKMRYVYQDSGPYDASTVAGGTATTTVGNIRLISCGVGICREPSIDTVLVGETTAALSWTGLASSYEVYAIAGTWDEPTTGIATTGTSYTFTDLTPGTEYSVGVRAVCENGTSEWVYVTITTDEHPCYAPSDLTVSEVTYSSAVLNWTPGEAETEWELHLTGTNLDTTFNVTTNPYTLTGLRPGAEYSVTVAAVCSATQISEATEAQTFTTPTCQPVSGVTANDITVSGATISWTAPTGVDNFELEYGLSGFGQGAGTRVSVTGTSYTLTGLAEATVYEVLVRSACATGVYSDWSNRTSFETLDGGSQEGIEDIANANIALYPNPATTTVTLTGFDGQATVTIVDMNGRAMGEYTANDNTLTIDLTGYAQGAYFVRITGEQVNAIRKLIVK